MVIFLVVSTVVLIVTVIVLFIQLAPQFGGIPDKKDLQNRAKNSVFADGKFHNAIRVPMLLPHSVPKMLREQFGGRAGRVPRVAIPSSVEPFDTVPENGNIHMRWLGHSTIFIQTSRLTLLIDPVFSKRASPVKNTGPGAFKGTTPYRPENIPNLDYIILSHDHFDHLDYQSIKQLHGKTRHFLVPLGVEYHLVRWGVDPNKISSFDWWESYADGDDFAVNTVPAQHFTGRRGRSNSTLWCSWIINLNGKKLFFNGDSGYSPHFRETGARSGPFDLTMIECGAYGDYWPYMHMKPEETYRAHCDLGGEMMMPIHWAKFNLAFHTWKDPIERLSAIIENSGIALVTPVIGESFILSEKREFKKWWEKIN